MDVFKCTKWMNEWVNWINEINDGINEFYVYFVKYTHYIKHPHTQSMARWESTYPLKDLGIVKDKEIYSNMKPVMKIPIHPLNE